MTNLQLKTHGRYDYSALIHRPDYSFPDGKRLAVHFWRRAGQ
jgi:allantoinase